MPPGPPCLPGTASSRAARVACRSCSAKERASAAAPLMPWRRLPWAGRGGPRPLHRLPGLPRLGVPSLPRCRQRGT
eukprot:6303637-Alexandrium_andersonii.AAC.1